MVSKLPEVSGPFVNVIKAIDSLLRKKMHKYKIFKQFRPIYLLTFQKLQVKELFFKYSCYKNKGIKDRIKHFKKCKLLCQNGNLCSPGRNSLPPVV